MDPHKTIKTSRSGKHAAAARDGRHAKATAPTQPICTKKFTMLPTPGPWFTKRRDSIVQVVDRNGRLIARFDALPVDSANAELIALAPELLELCRDAAHALATVPAHIALCERLVAMIAKATK